MQNLPTPNILTLTTPVFGKSIPRRGDLRDMYDQLDLGTVLFLDIECVSGEATLDEVEPALASLWREKAPRIMRVDELSEEEADAAYVDRAAIFAEFGKIVCISVGFITGATGEEILRVKSFADPDESVVLEDFASLLNGKRNFRLLCGHNIREFDIPYIARRMIVHGVALPEMLDIRGRKPWEVRHLLDTMEMWSFGDRKNYTSLKLLAALFGIPSPKNDIDGSQVGRVFWEENDLDRIAVYCERDVVATANVFLALSYRERIPDSRVVLVDREP